MKNEFVRNQQYHIAATLRDLEKLVLGSRYPSDEILDDVISDTISNFSDLILFIQISLNNSEWVKGKNEYIESFNKFIKEDKRIGREYKIEDILNDNGSS